METSLLESLQKEFPDQISGTETISPREGEFVDSHSVLPDEFADKLDITELYKHQADALTKLQQDNANITLTTGTDSGKTLVYALYSAIIAKENDETALCIYPTKALSRDQHQSLEELYDSLGLSLEIGVYDGDSTKEEKENLRENADVILTNFQGLNYYLPHHESWENFFTSLGLVVIDEAHMYTGIMGTHAAWITRRLLRLVEGPYESTPQVIVTTATLGNPREHTETLTGKLMEVIDTDYSPREKQEVIFWNPIKDKRHRRSPHKSITSLAPWLVENTGSQLLIFSPSRRTAELIMKWIREEVDENYDTEMVVESYHAGHSKDIRRDTEDRIKSGEVDITISTTALEVGIDIGDLDIVISDTYPGSRMSFWQQIGRAGRENTESTTFFVADKTSVDQYVIDNPEYLLDDDIEDAIIDLTNRYISSKHITVASREYPLIKEEEKYFTSDLENIVQKLANQGIVTGTLNTGAKFDKSFRPESNISLYSTSSSGFQIKIISDSGEFQESLPEVSKTRAYRELFEGATYLHKGIKYKVTDFIEQADKKEIHLQESDDLDYYTQSNREKEITDIKEESSVELEYGITIHKGQILVKERYPTYSKIYESTNQTVTDIPTGLSNSLDLQTEAMWITFDKYISEEIADRTSGSLLGSLHGAEHSLIELSPTILNVDAKDIGGLSARNHIKTGKPTIFIYDGIKGGIGYSFKIYDELTDVSRVATNRITKCGCSVESGCLECIMSSSCGSGNDPLHKKGSALITDILSRLVTQKDSV